MKKITLLMVLIAISFAASATIYLDETFNYSTGALKTVGAAGSWVAGGTYGSWASDFNVESNALTYSNAGGTFCLSGMGNKVDCNYQSPYGSTNYYNYKSFTGTAITSGTVYVSFLYTPGGVTNAQSQAPIMSISIPGSTTGVQVWVGKGLAPNDATHFRFGTTKGSTTSTDIKWGTEFPNSMLSDVFLIVLKSYVESTSANCVSSVFINPVIGTTTEPSVYTSDATSTSSVRTTLQTIQFKVNGSSKEVFKVSSVRVSSTWAEAVQAKSTAAPLSPPVVGSASSITDKGFTANWTSVTNAIGYDIKVYLGPNLISTTNVSGQATQSAVITGLMPGLTYTYKVIAKGDVTNYSDSEPSEASTDITTLDPYATNSIHTDFNDEPTWGTPIDLLPATGSYPSSSVNGFELLSSVLYTGTIKGIKGETHTNRIAIDRLSGGGKVMLPTLNSVEQIEIHATAGTAGNGFQLKEFNPSTNAWIAIGGTYVYDANSKNAGTDSIYIISISRAVPTKFRIENPTNGVVYLYQVITRTTNPTLLAKPTVNDATGILATKFTANWTPVANATGYKVWVYQGTTLVKTVEAAGQATSSVEVTGLEQDTEYSYKVQAIGDGDVNYSDSYLSVASIAFSTGNTTSVSSANKNIKIFAKNNQLISNIAGVVEVFGMQGNLILNKEIKNEITLNIPNGMYLVRLTGNDGTIHTTRISIR